MQQTAVLPNSFPAMRPSVLVSSSGHWVFWAVGAVRFEGDAAGRCLPDVMSHNAALLCLYTFRSLRGGPNGSRPWCLEVMQQTAVLPDVNACGAAISAVKVPAMPVGRSRLGGNAAVAVLPMSFLTMHPSVLVRRAINGSRPLVSWRGCSRLQCCTMLFPTRPPSVLV